jgi:hypothetical protein
VNLPESPKSLNFLYETQAEEILLLHDYPNLDLSKIKGDIVNIGRQFMADFGFFPEQAVFLKSHFSRTYTSLAIHHYSANKRRNQKNRHRKPIEIKILLFSIEWPSI